MKILSLTKQMSTGALWNKLASNWKPILMKSRKFTWESKINLIHNRPRFKLEVTCWFSNNNRSSLKFNWYNKSEISNLSRFKCLRYNTKWSSKTETNIWCVNKWFNRVKIAIVKAVHLLTNIKGRLLNSTSSNQTCNSSNFSRYHNRSWM